MGMPWLELFEREHISQSQRPWYVRWVERYCRETPEEQRAQLRSVQAFLSKIAGSGACYDWQIQQAATAICSWLQNMCGVEQAGTWSISLPTCLSPSIANEQEAQKQWKLAARKFQGRSDKGPLPPRIDGFLLEVREACRRNDLLLNTERTYLQWIRRFLVFSQPASRTDVSAQQVQEYLTRRHHLHEKCFQRALKAAAREAGLTKRVTSHTLRHSFSAYAHFQGC